MRAIEETVLSLRLRKQSLGRTSRLRTHGRAVTLVVMLMQVRELIIFRLKLTCEFGA